MTKKYVLLKALARLLPQEILGRRKRGFSIPLSDWLRGPLRDMMRSYLSSTALNRVGFFDARAVERLLDGHDRQVRNHETKLWVILSFMLWHELHISPRMGGESEP